jgi:hypothetical protein
MRVYCIKLHGKQVGLILAKNQVEGAKEAMKKYGLNCRIFFVPKSDPTRHKDF